MRTELPRSIVQIVPPEPGGVFDYQQCLRTQWAAHGVDVHTIAPSKPARGSSGIAEQVETLIGAGHCAIVLHYSGYGYARRGMCFWLLDELTRLKRQQGNQLRTVVVFHELFASGPPWRSAFWLSRLQATIAARLARQADALWTNTEHHARWLRKAAGPTVPLRMRPVFSNIGEPQAVRCNAMRVPRVVVFGSGTTRQRALDALRGQEERLRQLGIVELVEVGGGRPSRHLPRGLACRHAGRLAPAEIATLLESSRFGLLDYPSRYLAKSGVFAAYAAHGCVILNTSPLGRDTDGLFAGRDYLVLPALIGADVHTSAHEARSNDVLRWYARHRLAKQAQELLMLATQS